jgi:hypothetical protein
MAFRRAAGLDAEASDAAGVRCRPVVAAVMHAEWEDPTGTGFIMADRGQTIAKICAMSTCKGTDLRGTGGSCGILRRRNWRNAPGRCADQRDCRYANGDLVGWPVFELALRWLSESDPSP